VNGPDISELADLFLKLHSSSFKEVSGISEDISQFDRLVDQYCESHPHLPHEYPDKDFRRSIVLGTIRRIAGSRMEIQESDESDA